MAFNPLIIIWKFAEVVPVSKQVILNNILRAIFFPEVEKIVGY